MILDQPVKSKYFEVIPEAQPAVEMFLRVQTQWRTDQGVILGLDYNPLFTVMELSNIKEPLELLSDVQVIEGKIIEILSERSKKDVS